MAERKDRDRKRYETGFTWFHLIGEKGVTF